MDTIIFERIEKGELQASNTKLIPPSLVATMGVFDGVHKGHQYLIQQTIQEAKKRDLPSAVITFDRPPIAVVAPEQTLEQLHTLSEKIEHLQKEEIDFLIVLPFDHFLKKMTAETFMQNILKELLHIKTLLMGYDHHFGEPNKKEATNFQEIGARKGIEILIQNPLIEDTSNKAFSSTLIRQLLKDGEIAQVPQFLGYSYYIVGQVVKGQGIGRTFGYPTANISPESNKLVPKDGVYAVSIDIAKKGMYQGMLYIGKRPTIANGLKRTIEVNIFDFSGNLYDDTLKIAFHKRIRGDKKFNSHEELIEGITKDFSDVKDFFAHQN